MALVAEHKDPKTGQVEIAAVGRLSKLHGSNDAEAAVLVRDGFQHLGLGTELYRRLIAIAKDEHRRCLISTILAENREMRAICQKLGFKMHVEMEDQTVRAELTL